MGWHSSLNVVTNDQRFSIWPELKVTTVFADFQVSSQQKILFPRSSKWVPVVGGSALKLLCLVCTQNTTANPIKIWQHFNWYLYWDDLWMVSFELHLSFSGSQSFSFSARSHIQSFTIFWWTEVQNRSPIQWLSLRWKGSFRAPFFLAPPYAYHLQGGLPKLCATLLARSSRLTRA